MDAEEKEKDARAWRHSTQVLMVENSGAALFAVVDVLIAKGVITYAELYRAIQNRI